MSLDLNKLANKLDEALSNETSETLTKFLNDKRMKNETNKINVTGTTNGVLVTDVRNTSTKTSIQNQSISSIGDVYDYFGVIGMDNNSDEYKSLMESLSKMGMECRK